MAEVVTMGSPKKKKSPYPRLHLNSIENMERSLERLARWTLQKGRNELELSQVRVTKGVLSLRIELERLKFDREKWRKDLEIEKRIEEIEQALLDAKERDN
jgi:hypothetical protein